MSRQPDHHKPCVILVVDDDADDVFFFERGLSKVEPPHNLVHVKSGLEAMHYLKGDGEFGDRDRFPKPVLMVLDVKMPFMDGFEVLAAVRRAKQLSKLPIVVWSG